MKTTLLVLIFLASLAFSQSTKQSVQVTRIDGITSSWPGEGTGCAGTIDNRSAVSRRNWYHSLVASGTGSWSVVIQYSNTSCTGPWFSYGSSATINQSSNPSVAFALDTYTSPAQFINIQVTGNAVVTYVGDSQLPIATASSTVAFPITIGQGGTSATDAATALANLLVGSKQGTSSTVQMAGTNSGVAGASLCDDASGNATTSGCPTYLPVANPIFTGTLSGPAATFSGALTTNVIGGGVQCLHVNNSGLMTGTGSDCGGGGGSSSWSSLTNPTTGLALNWGAHKTEFDFNITNWGAPPTTAQDMARFVVNGFPVTKELNWNTASVTQALVGAISSDPSSIVTNSIGVAGYALGNSTTGAAVGVFGMGILGAQTGAFGANFGVYNASTFGGAGINGNMWGIEVDVSGSGAGAAPNDAKGIAIVTDMYQNPTGVSSAVRTERPVGAVSQVPWKIAFDASAGGAVTALYAGPTHETNNNVPSQAIALHGRSAGGTDIGGQLVLDSAGNLIVDANVGNYTYIGDTGNTGLRVHSTQGNLATATALFNNTAATTPLAGILNGAVPAYQRLHANGVPGFAENGLVGAAEGSASNTDLEYNGVFGSVTGAGHVTNHVAGSFFARAIGGGIAGGSGNSVRLWGMNPLVTDGDPITSFNYPYVYLTNEFDINAFNPLTKVVSWSIGGASYIQPSPGNAVGPLLNGLGTLVWGNSMYRRDSATPLLANIVVSGTTATANLQNGATTTGRIYIGMPIFVGGAVATGLTGSYTVATVPGGGTSFTFTVAGVVAGTYTESTLFVTGLPLSLKRSDSTLTSVDVSGAPAGTTIVVTSNHVTGDITIPLQNGYNPYVIITGSGVANLNGRYAVTGINPAAHTLTLASNTAVVNGTYTTAGMEVNQDTQVRWDSGWACQIGATQICVNMNPVSYSPGSNSQTLSMWAFGYNGVTYNGNLSMGYDGYISMSGGSGGGVALGNSGGNYLLVDSTSVRANGVALGTSGKTLAQWNATSPSDGWIGYCSDCTNPGGNTCNTGGSGTVIFRVSGAWKCL